MLGTDLEAIHRRIDELSAIATARMRQCDPVFSTTVGGAPIDFMDSIERQELHALQMKLPSFAELREQARSRIKQRVEARKTRR